MDDVRRGLIGRRVCGSLELAFGVLLLLGSIQPFSVLPFLTALLFIETGVLGIASIQTGVVIAYLVTGILCTFLLLVIGILSVVAIVEHNNEYGLDGTLQIIVIVLLVIIALGLIVAVLGVVFACLPLCGNDQTVPYQRHTTPNTVGPASYNYGNAAFPATMQGPPTYNHGSTADPVPMQEPPLQNDCNIVYPDTKQQPI